MLKHEFECPNKERTIHLPWVNTQHAAVWQFSNVAYLEEPLQECFNAVWSFVLTWPGANARNRACGTCAKSNVTISVQTNHQHNHLSQQNSPAKPVTNSETTRTFQTTLCCCKFRRTTQKYEYEDVSSPSVNDHVLPTHDEAFSLCNSFVIHKEHAHPWPIAGHDNCLFELIDPRTLDLFSGHPCTL